MTAVSMADLQAVPGIGEGVVGQTRINRIGEAIMIADDSQVAEKTGRFIFPLLCGRNSTDKSPLSAPIPSLELPHRHSCKLHITILDYAFVIR